jgi:DNA polymerase-1
MPQPLALLIDGTSQLFRAFYAIRELTDPQGRPVQGIFGFTQILFSVMRQERPDVLAIAFDRPEPTLRHQRFAGYKAQREAAPEDLVLQLQRLKALLADLGFAVLERPGWEADDIIATLARQADRANYAVRILSSDKDLMQLVNANIHVLRPRSSGVLEHLDPRGVKDAFGVNPEQMVDFLSLMGDVSDNIPGVPGIGPKTAQSLIAQFGSVDQLYARLHEVSKAKMKEKLELHAADVRLARELIPLATVDHLPWDPAALRPPQSPLTPQAVSTLRGLGFKKILSEFGFENQGGEPPAQRQDQAMYRSPAQMERLAPEVCWQQARTSGKLGVYLTAQALWCAASGQAVTELPLERITLPGLLAEHPDLRKLLQDPAVAKWGFQIKAWGRTLAEAGILLDGELNDWYLVGQLCAWPRLSPAVMAAQVLRLDPDQVSDAMSAAHFFVGADRLDDHLQAHGAQRVYYDIERPLLPILIAMETTGIAVDRLALQQVSEQLDKEAASLENEILALAGRPFNLRSPQQLAEILFDTLGLASSKKTKTGRSTNVEVLETLAAQHPLPERILEYRQVQKLKSTYVDALPAWIASRDQRLHTTFNQIGTATGRFSSTDPNLQNIPIRSERGKAIRRIFIPQHTDQVLLAADYSQIELRLLAHFSKDPTLCRDFLEGRDIHAETAAQIFKVPVAQVTPDMRRQAKTCNFGIAYGVSPFGLARQLRISAALAKEFIEGFFHRYPLVKAYIQETLELARQQGWVQTLSGRRRIVPDLQSKNRNVREAAERIAFNTPLQGTAADIIKLAMVRVDELLRQRYPQIRMLLQIHDELVFEGPESLVPAAAQAIGKVMQDAYALRVPLQVDLAWGKNWMEAHG